MPVHLARGLIAWWLQRVGRWAITLPPFGVFVLDGHQDDEALRRHEAVHWGQYLELGIARFYGQYLWQLWRYGYAAHPMEQPARQAERTEP